MKKKGRLCNFKRRRILFGNLPQRKKEAFLRDEEEGGGIPPPLTFFLPSPGWYQQLMLSAALESLRFILKFQGNE